MHGGLIAEKLKSTKEIKSRDLKPSHFNTKKLTATVIMFQQTSLV